MWPDSNLAAILSVVLYLVAFASANPFALGGTKCKQDPCLQRVQDSRKAGHPSACNNFFVKTVHPPARSTRISKTITPVTSATITTGTVSTATTTVMTLMNTTTLGLVTTLRKRIGGEAKPTTVSETSVPRYAQGYCANTAVYSSACSCVGATHRTTTLAARVSKSTTTVVAHTTRTETFGVVDYSTEILTSKTTVQITTSAATPTATVFPDYCSGASNDKFALQVSEATDPDLVGQYALIANTEIEYGGGRVGFSKTLQKEGIFTRNSYCDFGFHGTYDYNGSRQPTEFYDEEYRSGSVVFSNDGHGFHIEFAYDADGVAYAQTSTSQHFEYDVQSTFYAVPSGGGYSLSVKEPLDSGAVTIQLQMIPQT